MGTCKSVNSRKKRKIEEKRTAETSPGVGQSKINQSSTINEIRKEKTSKTENEIVGNSSSDIKRKGPLPKSGTVSFKVEPSAFQTGEAVPQIERVKTKKKEFRSGLLSQIIKAQEEEDDGISKIYKKIQYSQKDIEEWINRIKELESKNYLREYALSKERSDFKNKEEILEFIKNSPAKTDYEKLWVIFIFVTKNFTYQVEHLEDRENNPTGDPFLTGQAVCNGFSNVTIALCKAVGIECKYISGYTKSYGYKPGDSFEGKKTDHAWNIVTVEGKKRFIEITWAEGFADENLKQTKQFEPSWFLTPPEIFIYRHFPEKDEDQLLDEPLTMKEFEQLPMFKNNFFIYGFKMLKNEGVIMKKKANPFTILIQAPSESHSLLASLRKVDEGKKLENAIFIQKPADLMYELNINAPNGKYELTLYGKEESTENNKEEDHREMVSFIIENTSDLYTNEEWCVSYGTSKDAYLIEPKQKKLKKVSRATFKVQMKSDVLGIYLVMNGGKPEPFKKIDEKENIWELKTIVNKAGPCFISVKEEINEKTEGNGKTIILNRIFEYEIQ